MTVDTKHIENALSATSKAVIIGHFNPDGDSIGSITAMWHYLTMRGISATPILPSIYPDSLAFLDPGNENPAGRIIIAKDSLEEAKAAIERADTIICLDFNSMSRTEYLEKTLTASSAKKILIDHHLFPAAEQFDVVCSKTDISSACELLYWVLMNLPDIAGDVQKLPFKCAEAIYVGMMTDTNNFSNSVYNTTFEMASRLLERGVNKDSLQEKVLHCYTEKRTRLMGHLIKDKMVYLPKEHAAYMTLSIKEKEAHNFKPGDSEGFVNLPLAISDVQISALFTEDNSGEYIRVSIRSKGTTDVNLFANRYFNGGGHKNAAGGRLYMPIGDVPAYFEESLKKYIHEENIF